MRSASAAIVAIKLLQSSNRHRRTLLRSLKVPRGWKSGKALCLEIEERRVSFNYGTAQVSALFTCCAFNYVIRNLSLLVDPTRSLILPVTGFEGWRMDVVLKARRVVSRYLRISNIIRPRHTVSIAFAVLLRPQCLAWCANKKCSEPLCMIYLDFL